MFDVFYIGPKPNLFVHEQEVSSISQAQALSRTRWCWVVSYLADYSSWDWLWEPPPWQAQYTHVWPNQHHDFSGTYLVPKTHAIQYHFQANPVPNKHQPCRFRTVVDNVEFDYTWAPHPLDPPYIYVFGNQWWPANKMATVEYAVPGATERKYMDHPQAKLTAYHDRHWHTIVDCKWDYSWVPDPGDPPYIYVFGNQWHSAVKMPTVEYHADGATERKYMSWPRATLLPDQSWWTKPDNIDWDDVDTTWVPDPGSPPYIYQFGTQHQKTGGPVYTVPGATEIKYIDQLRINTKPVATAIYEIDHMDGNSGQIPNTVKKLRYFDNYRDTLLRLARSVDHEHEWIWVCSSVCNYSDFDFSWHPEQWQTEMLHVFASNDQKFGDTFYMHVPSFTAKTECKALLEWADVNFVDIAVPRRPMPVFVHKHDSQVTAVKNTDFAAPLALFTAEDHIDQPLVTVPLWRRETKAIVPISRGASAVIVPKAAVGEIQNQLYDWPHIDKQHVMLKSQPLDIVFISNGEPNAEVNFKRLTLVSKPNRTVRVDNVNGRAAAYHAAAQASSTPWFFAVFAKLSVDIDFDWTWQPDRMQQAKHYIFHARNPVNGLEYGHQAMIAYNRQLVLDNPGLGLDFTLDSAHEVVPILSGTAMYNTSAWSAWRTAFREVIKLRHSLPDVDNQYRLTKWLSINEDGTHVAYEDWSQWGAQDAMEYYDSVSGEFAELRKTYEWSWLASYAFMRRNLTPDR